MTRTCPYCSTVFDTGDASKIYCTRDHKERARNRRARLELAAYRLTSMPPSRWQRLRVALRWAWGGTRKRQPTADLWGGATGSAAAEEDHLAGGPR